MSSSRPVRNGRGGSAPGPPGPEVGTSTSARGSERRVGDAHRRWAQRGSNPRPLVCKTRALPLSYTPVAGADYGTRQMPRKPRTPQMKVEPLASRVTSGSTGHNLLPATGGAQTCERTNSQLVQTVGSHRPTGPSVVRQSDERRASWRRCSSRSRPSGLALWTAQRTVPSLSTTYDDRRGAPATLVEDVVGAGHLAVRPEVREQREVQPVGVREGAQRVDRVARDRQHLAVEGQEVGQPVADARPSRRCRPRRTRRGRRRARPPSSRGTTTA